MNINDKLRNTTIRHAIYMEQLKSNEVKKIISLLNKSDIELRSKLLSYAGKNPTITSEKLKLMKQNVREIMADAKQVYKNQVTKLATGVSQAELNFQGNLIKNAIPNEVPIAFIQPSPTQLLGAIRATPFANTTLEGMINDWSVSKTNNFTNAIQQAYIQGQSINDVASTIFGDKKYNYTNGIADSSRRQVRTQVRTAVNHFSSVSREVTYEQNKDIIKGVQWVATLDGRTTLLCAGLDGKVDLYDDTVRELNGFRPPAHYNCRSTTVPVIKSLKELGLSDKEFSKSTRASMNGQVPETETFASWFNKQDSGFQKKYLGNFKYEQFKEGKFTIGGFVQNNQTLTVTQLGMLDKKEVEDKPVRNYDNNFAKSINKENYDTMRDMVESKDVHHDVANIWMKYEDILKVGDMNNRGAFYSDYTRTINFDLVGDMKGSSYQTPAQTIFHESGHAIDYAIGRDTGANFMQTRSMSFEDGIFQKTIEKEIGDLVNDIAKQGKIDLKKNASNWDWLVQNDIVSSYRQESFMRVGKVSDTVKYTKAHAYSKLQKEIKAIPLIERGNISDIIEGATKAKVQGGIGHGKQYWTRDGALAKEAFAEMLDANMSNKASLAMIQKYVPKSYDIFLRMIKDI